MQHPPSGCWRCNGRRDEGQQTVPMTFQLPSRTTSVQTTIESGSKVKNGALPSLLLHPSLAIPPLSSLQEPLKTALSLVEIVMGDLPLAVPAERAPIPHARLALVDTALVIQPRIGNLEHPIRLGILNAGHLPCHPTARSKSPPTIHTVQLSTPRDGFSQRFQPTRTRPTSRVDQDPGRGLASPWPSLGRGPGTPTQRARKKARATPLHRQVEHPCQDGGGVGGRSRPGSYPQVGYFLRPPPPPESTSLSSPSGPTCTPSSSHSPGFEPSRAMYR